MTIPWNAYWRLMRFDKPIGTLLLLWPTWWALLLAGEGLPTLKNALIFTAGVVLMRAAGCVMNDIADRDFDPHVERTRCRPLAAGEVSLVQALGLFFVLMLLAFGLVLMTNALTIKLAFVGAALAASYPFFKRVTHLPQVAAQAHHQLQVSKSTSGDTTTTHIVALDPEQRVDELARMLGGDRGKGSLHEMGVRTPIVFSWPGVVPGGVPGARAGSRASGVSDRPMGRSSATKRTRRPSGASNAAANAPASSGCARSKTRAASNP